MNKNFRVFYIDNNLVYSLDKNDNFITEENDKRDMTNYNYYESMKGYEKTQESLTQFKNDFIKWTTELKKYGIDYLKYFNHINATYFTFLKYSTNNLKQKVPEGIKGIEGINFNEFSYYEKCYNAGLMSIDNDCINKEMEFYGYDFSAYYANILSKFDFQIPIKKGIQSKFTDLKKKLKYGIYHIKITCNDAKFKKIFSFSVNNYYTHYSINFCLKYKKQFNISFEIQDLDKEFNCLVYEDKDLINTSHIFIDWFNKLIEIKQAYPNNKLVKHLMSNIWGCMIQFERIIIKNDEELLNYDISDITSDEKTEYKILEIDAFVVNGEIVQNYKLIKSEQAYKRPFRIKPFLTSFARRQVAEFILQESIIDDVQRVQTDGIILKKEYDFSHLAYYPKPEKKHTGFYKWYSVNKNSLHDE